MHTVIAGPAGGGPIWSFRKHGRVTSVRVEARLTVTVNEVAVAGAVAGLGIVSTSLYSCRKELASGLLARVLADWDMGRMEVRAVLAAGRAAKPSARVFTEFLVAEFRTPQAVDILIPADTEVDPKI
jgi:DNA-binding transcriptional LysR family regulator